jgi:glycine cleavage system aminomethyltransferase T
MDVRIDNVTGRYAVLGVAGPKSRDMLQAVCYADLGDKAFPFFAVREIEIAGVPVRAIRVSYTGELVCAVQGLSSSAICYTRNLCFNIL